MNMLFNADKIFKISFIVILSLAILLIAFIQPNCSAEEYTARMSYHWYPKHHSAKYAEKFAEEVEKATDGRLKIEIYDSGQLYGFRETLPAVSNGSVEFGGLLDMNLAAVDQNFGISSMPLFFSSYDELRGFYEDTPEGQAVIEELEKKLDIKLLCYNPVGPTTFFSKKPMEGSLKELEGRKIRYLVETTRPIFEKLGMSTVSVSTGEVYTALKQGMINTALIVPSAAESYSWWDFFEYVVYPYQTYLDAWIVVNASWWNSLPDDLRKVIEEDVVPRIAQESTQSIMEHSDDVIKRFLKDEGGHFAHYWVSDLIKYKKLYQEEIWPIVAEERFDPEFYEAALEYVGHK